MTDTPRIPRPAHATRALLGGLVLLAAACGPGGDSDTPGISESRPLAIAGPRTVILVSLDTLRPDRLGVYGAPAGNSPRLDALADEAVVFDDALSVAPWTLPSHMSMLTGLDPLAHGVKRDNMILPQDVVTLAEVLQADGFATAAFTDGGFVSARYGFAQGFDAYHDQRSPEGPNGFARLLPPALDWLRASGDRDVFAFVHTFDVHAPFDEGDPEVIERFRLREAAPGPLDHRMEWAGYIEQQKKMRVDRYGRISELHNDYDAGVFEADRGVGAILDVLAETGRLDDALVIVTSDHGEAMFERGLHVGHGIALTDDELAIPLMIRFPAARHGGKRLGTSVDLVDITATVLDVFGLEPDDHMQGESLLRLAEGQPRRREYLLSQSANSESYALVRNGYKYITPLGLESWEVTRRHLGFSSPHNPNSPDCKQYEFGIDKQVLCYDVAGDPLAIRDHLPQQPQLFHRGDDPDERHNLAVTEAKIRDSMNGFLLRALDASYATFLELFNPETDEPAPTDPHVAQQLAQLGYMQAQAEGAGVSKEDFLKMSKAMRDALKHPHHPPDMAPVEAIDRRVHEVRLAVEAGEVPADAASVLARAGDDYVAWIVTVGDVQWWPRISWRLWELDALATRAGVTVDQDAWKRTAEQLLAAKQSGKPAGG